MAYDMGEEAKKRWIATDEWKYYSKAGKLQKIWNISFCIN